MVKKFIILICIMMTSNHVVYSEEVSTEVAENLSNMEKAKGIFDAIKESNIVKTAKEVSKWGIPLLKSIGFFAKVITSSFASESKELKFMKEQFKILNEKMDYVDQQFNEVKKLMDWNVVKIQYASYEMNSYVLKQQINNLADYPASIKKVATDKFLLSYDQLYKNAAENLYQGFLNPKKIFSDNLIFAIRKFTKDYRTQVETFFVGNIQLILKCLEIETFYMNLKNFTSVESFWHTQWEWRLNNLTNIMNMALEQVSENWEQTSNTDIVEFNSANNALSHKDYADKLYNFLTLKFPNRQWLVLVYAPLDSGKDHAIKVCKGTTQMQKAGHNIAVTSYPLTGQPFDRSKYLNICSKIPVRMHSLGHGPAHNVLLKYLEPIMDCKYNQIGAVIRTKSEKYYLTPASRAAQCEWNGYYYRVAWIHKTLHVLVLG